MALENTKVPKMFECKARKCTMSLSCYDFFICGFLCNSADSLVL